ncbi:MAG: 2-oxoglutarate oxidoreductase subunit KorA [Candidatus Ordinivivax streblomastigis]|uniref:2-oxoglutarate oxidoreductase subunit KorA n=1 Tax=Candidatus Ordinivivax streblomastigis TaxID=2540710 RepID=A0A5M8P187_9BACT|nr:MAG: 2-oxoglutarate oxidoreductase subunit KorA [Candidatus Ordinivivax streblomastigis]
MAHETKVKELGDVVIRFSGDSGDGMQLAGTLFSNLSAALGNEIITFPDYPAEIRAPHGTLSGVSGYQMHLGAKNVFTPGDKADVLIAMNSAALKVNAQFLKSDSVVIIDTDSFLKEDLERALFQTDDPFAELGLSSVQVVAAPITQMCKDALDGVADNKQALKSRNIFALGLVCWLFNRPLEIVEKLLSEKFKKKPAVLQANLLILQAGFNYGHNIHASVSTYRIETTSQQKGFYTDVNGNKATAYGLIAAAEKAGLQLFLGSYPITPATDIMQELTARKELGIKVMQTEDEIAGICTAIGASFAGSLAATSTSGPGLALKSEAIGLAVIAEIPLVIIDVQRSGPSTGMPTKSEQTDLLQALYGRNGESPAVVMAALSPTDCFDAAFWASKIALEHMTPVILLTDGYIANGSSAWRIPDLEEYPDIKPPYVTPEIQKGWTPYQRNPENDVRYWAIPGMEGFTHRIGGLEKEFNTSVISTDPDNHQKMVATRRAKIDKVANDLPLQEVQGDEDADVLVVGWGGTYGHLSEAVAKVHEAGHKVAFTHFRFIDPLPRNAEAILLKYKKVLVIEQNLGQFAGYLRTKIDGFNPLQFNRVKGQPFLVSRLVEEIIQLL